MLSLVSLSSYLLGRWLRVEYVMFVVVDVNGLHLQLHQAPIATVKGTILDQLSIRWYGFKPIMFNRYKLSHPIIFCLNLQSMEMTPQLASFKICFLVCSA